MLDVRRMRVLREVAVRGSFSAAAEALSFTQSAISQQIAALEREAGTHARAAQRARHPPHRGGRGARPPRRRDPRPAGRGRGRAGGDRRPARRPAADWPRSSPPASTLMPLAIAAFRARAPGRRAVDDHGRARGLASRCCAAASSTSRSGSTRRVRGEVDGIDRAHLLEDPMYLAMPLDHPLAHKRNLRLADLADEPWIAGATDCECNRLINARLRGRRLRAADRLRDRRLHRDAGLRRRGRRRLADRRARPHQRPRRHRRARSRPRDAGPRRSTPRRSRTATAHPATQAMLEILQRRRGALRLAATQARLVG